MISIGFLITGYSLGCRAPRICACRKWFREGFPVSPNCAVFEVFFFPDGNRSLQGVNDPSARVKCGRPVSRSHHDEDAGLTHFQTTQAMDDGQIPYLELAFGLLCQQM
jgi:hypothetical protein